MRKLLLNPTPLFRKLRQLSMLLTLLLALPQTAIGATETVTKTITLNKTVNETNFPKGQNLTTGSITLPVTITENGATYYGQITIESASISSYSSDTNGAVFKMKGSNASNSQFHLEVPGNYPAIPSQVTVETAYANASEKGAYFSVELDGSLDTGNTYDYKSTSTSLPNTTVTFTADGNPRTNRSSEGTFDIWFTIGANWDLPNQTQTTVTVKEITITYERDVYGITVAGTSVKSDNATDILGDGKVSYNATTNTLTLNGATINYTTGDAITSSTTNPLNVNILGTNSISCGDHKAFNTSGNLVFQTSGGVAPGQLTITSTSNIDPQSFYTCAGTVTYDNDLAATSNGANSVIISFLGYELYIDGTRVTSGNASDVLSGTANAGKVSYNAADNILTLNGASLSKIRTEISGLKINLVGTNTIVASDSAAIQRAIPSNNDSGTAITLSFNGTGNLTITKKLITGTTYYSSINNYITVSYNDGLVSEDGASTTRISKGYNLTIAGTTVTELNSPDVFGDSKVSFTPASTGNNNTNTLTLNNVTFDNPIISGLDNLTIDFSGNIKIGETSGYINSTVSTAVLTFKSTSGEIEIKSYGDPAISGFASVAYDGTYLKADHAIQYVSGSSPAIRNVKGQTVSTAYITTTFLYPLWVHDRQVSGTNYIDVLGDGTVSYVHNNANNTGTLTLNGASIDSSDAIEGFLNGLIIYLKGDNSLRTYTNEYSPICSGIGTAELTIAKHPDATGDVSLSLTYAGTAVPVLSGFASVSYSGLNFVSKTGSTLDGATTYDALLSSAAIYPLWVAGTMVTENASSGAGWSYDGNTNTLTLDGYTSTFDGHAFAINMPNLNVYLKGTNTVGYNNILGYQAFYSYYTDATLTFSTDENNMGKLDASYYATFCHGFKAENGIYCNNGLGYYPSTCMIEAKKTPTIKFVTRDQTNNGSIPANQTDYVYVPDNGIQIPYAASYYAPKPVFSDHYQLSDTTRYEYTMSVDGVVQFTRGGTTQGNPGKIDYADNGEVSIQKSGTVTITCSFPGNMQNNACSASYTLKITRDFNNPFANQPAEQIYATYYNGDEDLTLPDGITAYVITGISGNTVTTTATGYLPHEVPVLLEKTGNVGTTITGYTGSAGNFSGNLLKYADQTFSSTGKEYVLYMNEFVKATGNIPGSRCYLDLSSVNPSRGMYGIGDGTTSIRELRMENEGRDEWYDLQGRRIEQPTKAGLYIKNGKKVIVNIK